MTERRQQRRLVPPIRRALHLHPSTPFQPQQLQRHVAEHSAQVMRQDPGWNSTFEGVPTATQSAFFLLRADGPIDVWIFPYHVIRAPALPAPASTPPPLCSASPLSTGCSLSRRRLPERASPANHSKTLLLSQAWT